MLLIDGDVVLYKAAFAAQKRRSVLYIGDERIQKFSLKRAAQEWVKEKYPDLTPEDYEIRTELAMLPFENVAFIINAIMDKIFNRFQSDEHQLYITGKGNFREQIAVTHKYKGNRDDHVKPLFYNETKELLIKRYDAEVVDGMEADDAMGINQTHDSIIVTIDKDLDMIPGWHYNFDKEDLYEIDPFTADYVFFKQLLTGDSTDNIIGLKGYGPVKAERVLAQCSYDEALPTIYEHYQAEYGERAYDRMVENGNLLWILRPNNQRWEAPSEKELSEKAQSL